VVPCPGLAPGRLAALRSERSVSADSTSRALLDMHARVARALPGLQPGAWLLGQCMIELVERVRLELTAGVLQGLPAPLCTPHVGRPYRNRTCLSGVKALESHQKFNGPLLATRRGVEPLSARRQRASLTRCFTGHVLVRPPAVEAGPRRLRAGTLPLELRAHRFGASPWFRAMPPAFSARRFHQVSLGCELDPCRGVEPR
jgi:hypothetical protein